MTLDKLNDQPRELFIRDATCNEEERSVTVPTIHRNGTSRKELVEQLLNASNALLAGLEAMSTATPDMRDYFAHVPNGSWPKAIHEHEERMEKVRSAKADIDAIAATIYWE